MARTTNPDPTVEIGNANSGIAPWSAFYDQAEDVGQLAFPASIAVYNKMRNDSQIAALLLAFMLPIFGYRWYIDPNGARDRVVEDVANDFNLPIEGQDAKPSGRQRDRFSFGDYLYHSLLKMAYGFMFHEQVYRLDADGKLHIRKLAPRMPGSIQQIQTADDGGLEYIRQYPGGKQWDPNRSSSYFKGNGLISSYSQGPIIPVTRLIAHVQDKEGGNWFGRSWLRSIYKEWLLKDRVLRVDAMKHERNGMGVPTIEAPPGATQAQMQSLAALATAYKSGEASGGALPNGAKLTLNGVSGALPDSLSSIRYYDEQMARRFLAMFTTLGSTETGSRALGETFVDFFALGQQSMAKSIADVTNAHAIEDLVDLNESIDESAPLLKFKPETDRSLATADLVALVNVGVLTADSELEKYVRTEGNLPKQASSPRQEPSMEPSARIRRPHAGILNAASQREPSDIEEQAKVDFTALKKTFDKALSTLVDDWNTTVKQPQVNELVALIAATDPTDLIALAGLQATPRGALILSAAAAELANAAADMAVKEIADQGLELDVPDLDGLKKLLQDRAEAIEVVMANALSQSASSVALAQAGGNVSSTDLAISVGDHLNGLSDAYLKDQLGGTLMQAQNGSRRAVFDTVPDKQLYASELLDGRTCEACSEVDGTEYATVTESEEDYPLGGYRSCLGGYRCRGTVVAVLDETAPTLQ